MKHQLFIVSILLTFAFMGCDRKFNRIIDNKDKIIPLCYNKTMAINRRIYLETYNEERLQNEYLFDRIEGEGDYYYVLKRDSIQFSPDDIIGIIPDGSELYRQQICDYFKEMSLIMEHYDLIWFADNSNDKVPVPGIAFGLDNDETLEYRPGMSGELKSYRKFKDEWYVQE